MFPYNTLLVSVSEKCMFYYLYNLLLFLNIMKNFFTNYLFASTTQKRITGIIICVLKLTLCGT